MDKKSKEQITKDRIKAGVKISKLESKNLIRKCFSCNKTLNKEELFCEFCRNQNI